MIEELKSEVNKLMPEQNRQHSEKVASLVAAKASKYYMACPRMAGEMVTWVYILLIILVEGGESTTSMDDPAFLPKFKWNEDLRQRLYNILKVDQAITTISNDIA